MNVMLEYVFAFSITITAEFMVFWILLRKEPLKLFMYSVLVNSLTWPIANYAYNNVLNNFLFVEAFVFLAEIILIKLLLEIKYRKALYISFIANLITGAISLLFIL